MREKTTFFLGLAHHHGFVSLLTQLRPRLLKHLLGKVGHGKALNKEQSEIKANEDKKEQEARADAGKNKSQENTVRIN